MDTIKKYTTYEDREVEIVATYEVGTNGVGSNVVEITDLSVVDTNTEEDITTEAYDWAQDIIIWEV